MTTRLGILIITAGIVLIVARAVNWVDTEAADIVSTLAIVLGALVVAIDGDSADQPGHPPLRDVKPGSGANES
ncbi:MAG: hypothetical protein JWM47_1208 [Acidimicrobiales bacterium]|nr:hypothetical protein [Acidimicrobiales bacterium]